MRQKKKTQKTTTKQAETNSTTCTEKRSRMIYVDSVMCKAGKLCGTLEHEFCQGLSEALIKVALLEVSNHTEH